MTFHVTVFSLSFVVYLPLLSFQIPSPCSCGFVLLPDRLPDYFHLFTLCVFIVPVFPVASSSFVSVYSVQAFVPTVLLVIPGFRLQPVISIDLVSA